MLKENYEEVQKKITEACKRAGRNREEVTLIAVSKTKPVEMLSEIYDLGERNFGENKVQELTEKEEVLPKNIHWHMIGHLQRNKVKYIAGKDSFRRFPPAGKDDQRGSGKARLRNPDPDRGERCRRRKQVRCFRRGNPSAD